MKRIAIETLKRIRNNIIVFAATNIALLAITMMYNPIAFFWIFIFILIWGVGLVMYYVEIYKNMAVTSIKKTIKKMPKKV